MSRALASEAPAARAARGDAAEGGACSISMTKPRSADVAQLAVTKQKEVCDGTNVKVTGARE